MTQHARRLGRSLLVFVLAASGATAQTAGTQALHGVVPAVVTRLQPTGRLPEQTQLRLAIGLPLRNQGALTNLLQQIYDPSSPQYRQYLTPEQFTEKFGPTAADYQTLADFAKAHGLTVSATHSNRVILDVAGTVADIEKTFHVTMRVYQHPTENRTFYAPDVEPSLDLALPILHIAGFDNYRRPHPKLHKVPVAQVKNVTPHFGSGPSGSYLGNDFRAAYVPGVALTGTGQTLGVFEFDGYYAGDITTYESNAGLPNVPVVKVLLDGFSGRPTTGPDTGNAEVALDIEMAISMAPGLSQVLVYEAGPDGLPDDILSRMVQDNQAKELSCSWAWGGGADPVADQLFQQMALQGQSFFDASGDSDAIVGDTTELFPSDDPNITQVGGTTLTTTGPVGSYVSETVWNSGYVHDDRAYLGSSGGFSTLYPIPTWQQGTSTSANQGSSTMRNIPDVAMVANDVAIVADNGQKETVVGTSCATPLWAGFTALVNQQALASGQPLVGFVNPAIYALGKSANYPVCFHDITTGNNEWSGSPTMFSAVAGYDLCTGWGTPSGNSLINALAGTVAADLSVAAIASPSPAVQGQSLSYTITVLNNSAAAATGVTVTDTLPAGVTFVSAAASQGTTFQNGGTVIAALGSLAGNATALVQIEVIPTATGVIADIVTVSSSQTDPNPANNTATVTTTVLVPPQLGVTPAPDNFGAIYTGTTAFAALTITNTGGGALTGTATASGGPFAVVLGNSFSVPVAGSTLVVVSFAPPSGGNFTGAVVVNSNGGSFTNQLMGSGTTNVPPPDTTPPTLTVLSPTAGQILTTGAVTVSGTASDASGITSVTVNGLAATVTGTDWSAPLTLALGTNTITVIATDHSVNQNTTTQIVQAIYSPQNIQPPVILSSPVVTNALLQVGDVAVVMVDETNLFTVAAIDQYGEPLSYQWTFGDGTSSALLPTNIASHAYITTNCGPATASVAVSDGLATSSSNLTVVVACELTITDLLAKLNFAKTNADTCTLKGTMDLGVGYDVTNKFVTVSVSGAQAQFILDPKGKGHGVGPNGTCELTYNKKTALWSFTTAMKNGFWQDAWANEGLIDATVTSVPVQLTPVILIDTEAFAAERSLTYTAKAGKSGTAK